MASNGFSFEKEIRVKREICLGLVVLEVTSVCMYLYTRQLIRESEVNIAMGYNGRKMKYFRFHDL